MNKHSIIESVRDGRPKICLLFDVMLFLLHPQCLRWGQSIRYKMVYMESFQGEKPFTQLHRAMSAMSTLMAPNSLAPHFNIFKCSNLIHMVHLRQVENRGKDLSVTFPPLLAE